MTLTIGIDLGGTKINGLIIADDTPQPLIQKKIATEGHLGADAVLQRIMKLCRELCDEADKITWDDISGVGIGVPATIDYGKGETILMPNISGNWHRKPVENDLEQLLNRSTYLINDARAFTLAEANYGAGREYPVVACFTLGTGIGGGIAIQGQLHMGMDGNAGEFGHTTVDINGVPDGTGTLGAIEAYGSGPAIAAQGVKAVLQGVNTSIGQIVEQDLNKISPHTILQAVQSGDEVAKRILDDAGLYIGAGVANVITILAPHCVVFGGGLVALGDALLNPIKSAIQTYNHTLNLDKLEIKTAELGDDAGAIGAALWARQRKEQSA